VLVVEANPTYRYRINRTAVNRVSGPLTR
jgi:hypothetical protein